MRQNKLSFAYSTIFFLSATIVIFLTWFIYFKPEAQSTAQWVTSLPAVNAALNSLCASFLIIGYIFIRKGQQKYHVISMSAATITSALFLVSYLTYHHFHGDTKFIAQGLVRPIYFFILISHIILSIAMVPMVFITLWNAFTSNYEKHKKWARKTLPVWLYVSVTGVLIFIFLKYFNH